MVWNAVRAVYPGVHCDYSTASGIFGRVPSEFRVGPTGYRYRLASCPSRTICFRNGLRDFLDGRRVVGRPDEVLEGVEPTRDQHLPFNPTGHLADFVALTLFTFDERVGQLVVAERFRFGIVRDGTIQPHGDVDGVADVQHAVVRLHV